MAYQTTDTSYGLTQQWTTVSQKNILFKIKNTQDLNIQIFPKSQAMPTSPTESKSFNENLSFRGNNPLPISFLDYFGSLGWMNLSIKGSELLVIDDFYDRMKGLKAYNMLASIHPIWGSTVQAGARFDSERTQQFLDKLVDLIEAMGAQ